MSIETRINALIKDGVTETARVKAYLIIDGYKPKEITEALKLMGITGIRKEFRSYFHDFLVEKNPTEEEAIAYIEGKGEYGETSDNVKRHLNVYLNEYKLANRIRAKYESKSKSK